MSVCESYEKEPVLNLLRLNKICQDRKWLLNCLREWKLIPEEGVYSCPRCHGWMTLTKCSKDIDGWKWYCNNYYKKYGPKMNPFQEMKILRMTKILNLINLLLCLICYRV